jgi:hypothetical protein
MDPNHNHLRQLITGAVNLISRKPRCYFYVFCSAHFSINRAATQNNNVDVFIENSGGHYGVVSVINGLATWDMESTPNNPQIGTTTPWNSYET